MSNGAELRVVLISDDPEQQEAFRSDMQRRDDAADLQSRIKEPTEPTAKQPAPVAQPQIVHQQPPVETLRADPPEPPAKQPTAPVVAPVAQPQVVEIERHDKDEPTAKQPITTVVEAPIAQPQVTIERESDSPEPVTRQPIVSASTAPIAQPQAPDDNSTERPLIESIDQLIEHLDRLIMLNEQDGRRSRPTPEPATSTPAAEPSYDGLFGELSQRLNKVLDHAGSIFRDTHFGRSIAGQRLLHTGRLARRAVGAVSQKVRTSKFGKRMATKLSRFRTGRSAKAIPPTVATESALASRAATSAAATTGAEGASAAAAGSSSAAAAAIGPIVAVGVAAAGSAIALHQMIQAVHHAADSLEDMSPEIATVRAEFEAMHEMARLDRAARIGAGAANLEAARGRIGESMYELQTKMLEVLLKAGPALEAILNAINIGIRGVDAGAANVAVVVELVKDLFGDKDPKNNADAEKWAKAAGAELTKAFKIMFANYEDIPPMDPFLAEVFQLRAGNKKPPQAPAPGFNPGMNGPGLPGLGP